MPFRTYSSGMQARLTFATAVTVNPDVLIIDEALSVGDSKFQLKSFNRIREFKERGKTILLVSHGIDAVTSFCDRAILLDKGSVLADGDPAWVSSVYHHLQFGELDPTTLRQPAMKADYGWTSAVSAESGSASVIKSELDSTCLPFQSNPVALKRSLRASVLAVPDILSPMRENAATENTMYQKSYRYGDKRATINGVALVDSANGQPVREITVGDVCQMVLDGIVHNAELKIFAGFLIRDSKGDILFGADTTLGKPENGHLLENLAATARRRVIAEVQVWLTPGVYYLSGALTVEAGTQSDMWFDAYEFRVVGPPTQHTNSRVFLAPVFTVLPIP
jgi:lipopolysaccharide transport system ATP-binding protein